MHTFTLNVYTKPNCSHCRAVKDYLTNTYPTEFNEKPITPEVAEWAKEKGVSMAPIVVYNGEPHGGFQPDLLAKIIKHIEEG